MNWSWGLRSMLPIFRPFFHQIKASKCNFVSFLKVRAFSDFHSLLCFLLLFPQSRFFDSLSAECFQCIAMVGQWDAGTAQKNRFVLFLDSASVTIYPPQHLPQGTGFSDNKPLVLLPFCPQRTFSVSCTWWFILDVRFPRLLLSKISRYSRADQRDHPADASTASFSQILWSRGICRLGMPRQCGRAFVELWWKRSLHCSIYNF